MMHLTLPSKALSFYHFYGLIDLYLFKVLLYVLQCMSHIVPFKTHMQSSDVNGMFDSVLCIFTDILSRMFCSLAVILTATSCIAVQCHSVLRFVTFLRNANMSDKNR